MSTTKPVQLCHVVMWRMNGATPEERLAQARLACAAFEATRGRFNGVLDMQVGVNVIVGPDAWDLALSMRFASRQSLSEYLDHPVHLEVKRVVGPLRAERRQVDFEVAI